MKKILLTLVALAFNILLFAQDQPVSWSGAGVKFEGGSPVINERDDLVTAPPGILLWSQFPDCSNALSSEIISAFSLTSLGADDFQFATGNVLTGIKWWFGVYNGTYSPFANWTISIYDNASCLPVNLLQQWTIPLAASNEAFHCNTSFGFPIYSYWATLTPTFTASSGTTYWVTIQAGDHIFPGQWGWAVNGTISGCVAAWKSAYFGYPNWTSTAVPAGQAVDFAYELYGGAETPVSDWALYIGIGLILAFAVVRFRKMV